MTRSSRLVSSRRVESWINVELTTWGVQISFEFDDDAKAIWLQLLCFELSLYLWAPSDS